MHRARLHASKSVCSTFVFAVEVCATQGVFRQSAEQGTAVACTTAMLLFGVLTCHWCVAAVLRNRGRLLKY